MNRKSNKIERVGNLYFPTSRSGFGGNVVKPNGIAAALTTMKGTGREPLIIEEHEI